MIGMTFSTPTGKFLEVIVRTATPGQNRVYGESMTLPNRLTQGDVDDAIRVLRDLQRQLPEGDGYL
jgi:hypothetical protein